MGPSEAVPFEAARPPSRLDRILFTPALADWVLSAYFCTVIIGLSRARPSPDRNAYLAMVASLAVVYLTGVFLYRRYEARVGRDAVPYAARLAYHIWPMAGVLCLYFNLRPILPIINGASYDAALYRLDLAVFGLEPTLAIERLTSARVVEWFAFFYYSYFVVIASYIFVMIFTCASDERLASFATGILIIVGIGHYVYTLVPGVGPYAYLGHEYGGPLEGGPFYYMVLDTVSKAGPMRDIFPSLHTALPTFLSLYAWKHYPRFRPADDLLHRQHHPGDGGPALALRGRRPRRVAPRGERVHPRPAAGRRLPVPPRARRPHAPPLVTRVERMPRLFARASVMGDAEVPLLGRGAGRIHLVRGQRTPR
jgi:hypothetical protein